MSNSTGAIACIRCTAGTYSGFASTVCLLCPAGYYSSDDAASTCKRYCSVIGAHSGLYRRTRHFYSIHTPGHLSETSV